MRKTIRLTGAVALGAAGVLALSMALTGPANADPAFTPDANDIVGVGSNTTEFLMQALAGKFNDQAVGGSMRMASFDAEGSATIVLRAGLGPDHPAERLVGGNRRAAGQPGRLVRALLARPERDRRRGHELLPVRQGQAQLRLREAEQQRRPQPDAPRTCSTSTRAPRRTGPSSASRPGHIQAKVPQAGSGTRTFFLASIGETETQLQDAIDQPDSVCSVTEVEEHDPSAVIGQPNAIAPFSVRPLQDPAEGHQEEAHLRRRRGAPFNVTRNVYNVIRTADAGIAGPVLRHQLVALHSQGREGHRAARLHPAARRPVRSSDHPVAARLARLRASDRHRGPAATSRWALVPSYASPAHWRAPSGPWVAPGRVRAEPERSTGGGGGDLLGRVDRVEVVGGVVVGEDRRGPAGPVLRSPDGTEITGRRQGGVVDVLRVLTPSPSPSRPPDRHVDGRNCSGPTARSTVGSPSMTAAVGVGNGPDRAQPSSAGP